MLLGLDYESNRQLAINDHEFAPHIPLLIQCGRYTIKTISSRRELHEVFQFRHEVFYEELMAKGQKGMDYDYLDEECDHLIIIDDSKGKIIANYRLLSSRFCSQFYSENEFNISKFLRLPGHKLEMGRACVHKDYRKGPVVHLLWRGVAEYLKRTETEYLFGCASLRYLDSLQVAVVCEYLERNNHISKDYGIRLLEGLEIPGLSRKKEFVSRSWGVFLEDKVNELMNPLFRSYLKVGSVLFENPAWDKKLKSVDFFTVLKIKEMNPAFARRYGL